MELNQEQYDELVKHMRTVKFQLQEINDTLDGRILPNNIHNNTILERHIKAGAITADKIKAGAITADKITLTLDDIPDGFNYGKVSATSIEGGKILLSEANGVIDDIADGTYGKVLSSSLSEGVVLLSQTSGSLDDIADGTNYGKVKVTNISAGNILLAQCVGNLDDIADGTNYGKVALTSISAGKIIVAGLDSGVTDRMFSDLNTKTAIEAWRHTNDVTMIDGGKIYANSITLSNTANDYSWGNLPDDGNKPEDNANVTENHTSADTTAVNGLPSTTISAWAHTSDTTYINGGKIYTNSITADKINVTSLSAITATLGTVHSGTIYGTRFRVGSGTDEDIYFEDSEIRMYDALSGYYKQIKWRYGSLDFAKLYYYTAGVSVITLNNASYYTAMSIGNNGALGTNSPKMTIGFVDSEFNFYNTGTLQLPSLTSAPTGHNGDITYNSEDGWFSFYARDQWKHVKYWTETW